VLIAERLSAYIGERFHRQFDCLGLGVGQESGNPIPDLASGLIEGKASNGPTYKNQERCSQIAGLVDHNAIALDRLLSLLLAQGGKETPAAESDYLETGFSDQLTRVSYISAVQGVSPDGNSSDSLAGEILHRLLQTPRFRGDGVNGESREIA